MTTIDAAAAWRGNKSVVFAVVAAFTGLGLGGCETGASLFANSSEPESLSITGQPPATASQGARIAVAPIIGAPDNVAKQLEAKLASTIEAQRIPVAKDPNAKAEYTLRGYIVSAREKGRTKVSYIWDVTDPAGKRVNRITGEEVLSGTQSKDPWASVTPQVIDTISTKTAGSLATWLPSQGGGAVASAAQPTSAGAAPTSYTQTAAVSAQPTATATTTGSIGREGKVTAMVPSVVGAPGDGSVALTSAIQRELSRSGVSLTDAPSAQTYKVEGKVVVGQGQNGKQPIQIDWDVKDPQGKKLGTVSQKNEIPQGSLDGSWGKTADAAASAAAQGIVKLLPKVN
ncbi:hypothetical protein [Hyphomicrobium sp. CS1GBMeth3]|uniref:hypothetical protein n=1 Tax=Hyphomicrobium sp. CS1GBMeth3 TaxID=1892845 RepID=UPI000930A245|nr:hypothetical protein [Hyphomicrobium sp. CS1GBMeth3]